VKVSDGFPDHPDDWGGRPWQHPEGDQLEPTLFGGVMASAHLERAPVIKVLRAAVALVSSWIGVELTWSTEMFNVEDNHAPPWPDRERPGIDWDLITGRGGTSWHVDLTGVCTALAADPTHRRYRIAQVHAEFPFVVPALGRELGGTSIRLSVQRWAMDGSGEQMPWFAAPLEEWLVDSAVALEAETGYVSLDTARAKDSSSAWERRAFSAIGRRDPRSWLWGYGWGTLLSPAHLTRIGGLDRLRTVPGVRLREVPGDRTWVTVGRDPTQASDGAMRLLHEVLSPALPTDGEGGFPAFVLPELAADAQAGSPNNGAPSPVEIRCRWEEDAESARAAGRGPGPWGPVGFTLDAAVPEVVGPFATYSGPQLDLVGFQGLGAQPAALLLDRLGAGALDEPSGPGPSLRAALRAAVAHPGVVLLQGHVVGPGRDDERITVEGVHVVGDPVLDSLGAPDHDRAWRRLVELGLDDAQTEPDELRPPGDDGEDEPGTIPGAWTVWWD